MDSKEAEKIRQIINYQKTLYRLSSLSSSSFSSPRKSSSLLNLMKEGSTSLRRLFDMERISLGNYLKDYSVSPIIRPIFLWGSESDEDIIHDDPWAEMKQNGGTFGTRNYDDHQDDGDFMKHNKSISLKTRKRKLIRTKSYKSLPRFSSWRCGVFRFRLKFTRRLRIRIWD
ncbi:hypothetical protein PHJA_001582200 [Phtheirospermum japonicum]|uniref:Uncharacterized protein n=1 Tax=Phtheirospermum japonicum TaxID=374723 RepID=A0A830CBH1_9LAMI|nr:hypothetical protein PHJA_001582200 [Phtheirospermum japonicum]